MTTLAKTASAAPTPGRERQRARQPVGGPHLGRDASQEAKRLASAILEVLAGIRTTADAAAAVGLSLTRYYQVESRALAGFLQACEPRGRRRQPSAERELIKLRHKQDLLEREVVRQQALVRLAQRSVGLAAPAAAARARPNGKKPRRRRPVARALQVAQRLQANPLVPEATHSVQQQPTETCVRGPSEGPA